MEIRAYSENKIHSDFHMLANVLHLKLLNQ